MFNRISRLTESDYEETPIGRLEPSWLRGNVATHTFNAGHGYEVVDGQHPVFLPWG